MQKSKFIEENSIYIHKHQKIAERQKIGATKFEFSIKNIEYQNKNLNVHIYQSLKIFLNICMNTSSCLA